MNMQELTEYFLQYGAFFIYLIVFLEYLNLPGFPAGVIMPLSGIWAAKGEISFFFRYGYYSGRRAYRQLASVFHRQTWRSEGDGILFQKISEASGSCGRKDGIPEEEGEYRSIYKQTHPCGTYPDFCPCRNDKDGFQEIYNQFRRRSIPVESGLCRSRIFLWRTRNYIFYTRRNLK